MIDNNFYKLLLNSYKNIDTIISNKNINNTIEQSNLYKKLLKRNPQNIKFIKALCFSLSYDLYKFTFSI